MSRFVFREERLNKASFSNGAKNEQKVVGNDILKLELQVTRKLRCVKIRVRVVVFLPENRPQAQREPQATGAPFPV